MKRLLYFLYAYRNGVVFLSLELISTLLIFHHQAYEKPQQLNAAHDVIGSIYHCIHELKSYPSLKKAYKNILQENTALREALMQKEVNVGQLTYEAATKQYACISARVINNSIISTKNYLTIDKGAIHGLAPGMGVISAQGVVGKIKAVSDHFATVISLLHTGVLVSAKVIPAGVMGTVRWLGQDPWQAQLLYVPRHVSIGLGDTVVTSGYNAIFDEGFLIGRVKHVSLREEALFYDIVLDISTDFSTLQHVYVVKDGLQQEKDALEQYTRSYYE